MGRVSTILKEFRDGSSRTNILLVGRIAELLQPLVSHVHWGLIAEGEDDEHVLLESFIVISDHLANDISCEHVTVVGSDTTLDHPEYLCHSFLLRRHIAVAGNPDWKRHLQIEQTWCVRKGDVPFAQVVLELDILGRLGLLSATSGLPGGSEGL